MAIKVVGGHQSAADHTWPAQAFYNRQAWLSLVAPLMLAAANSACQKAVRGAAKGAPLAGKKPLRAGFEWASVRKPSPMVITGRY